MWPAMVADPEMQFLLIDHLTAFCCALFSVCFIVNLSRTGPVSRAFLPSLHVCDRQSNAAGEGRQEFISSL